MTKAVRLASPVDDRDFMKGWEDAPVTIVEYGDYECPYSAQLYFVLKRLAEDLDVGDSFRLVFRSFPLTQIRPHALSAALAAEAAGQQNAFWQMHDILFEHQDGLEPEHLIVYAQVLGLDVEQFIVDMTSDNTAGRVRADFVGGIRSGVNGTPTLYINGVRHDDLNDYETLKGEIAKATKSRTRDVKKTKVAARRHASSRL